MSALLWRDVRKFEGQDKKLHPGCLVTAALHRRVH